MNILRPFTFHALVLHGLLTMGCASSAGSDAAAPGDESDVVGVADLGVLEAELGLVHDVKLPNGQWSRDVTKGDCYTRGQAANPHWEFRRYKNGAAFFDKKGTAPATGDSRPVVCLEVSNRDYSVALGPRALDAAVRFHLGKVDWSDDGASAGSVYFDFARGSLKGPLFSVTCAEYYDFEKGASTAEPAGAGVVAYKACMKAGGADHACYVEARKACEDAGGRSDVPGEDVLSINMNAGAGPYVSWAVEIAVHDFAIKRGVGRNVFDMATDAVGKFVGFDPAGADGFEHVRFEKLDAHVKSDGTPTGEKVFITPKNSDARIQSAAIAAH